MTFEYHTKNKKLYRSEFYICVPNLVKIDWEMAAKNPRWPQWNLGFFFKFQHLTAMISRASSRSPCCFSVLLCFLNVCFVCSFYMFAFVFSFLYFRFWIFVGFYLGACLFLCNCFVCLFLYLCLFLYVCVSVGPMFVGFYLGACLFLCNCFVCLFL